MTTSIDKSKTVFRELPISIPLFLKSKFLLKKYVQIPLALAQKAESNKRNKVGINIFFIKLDNQ